MILSRSKLLPGVFLVASITAWAVDKDGENFSAPSIEQMASKQTVDGVTVAAEAYNTEAKARTAFGKLNPYEHGVLPVIVVIRNDSKKTIRLADMKPQYLSGGRDRVEAIPAGDVKYSKSPSRPNMSPGPIPGIKFNKKNPLASEVIEMRAFSAKMLPPGESAYGFVYFLTGHRRGSAFYLSGLVDAGTGQELFYFEMPLD
jgi:hypothetical protein